MEANTNKTVKRAFGAIYSGVDVRDYKMVCTKSAEDFPEEFALKTVRIKDQGSVGSCVAHALSSIVEYYNSVQRGDTTEMSTGYIYGNRSNSLHKDAGMVVRDALGALRSFGDVPKKEFPENIETPDAIDLYKRRATRLYTIGYPNRISKYCRIRTVGEAKQALASNVPLVMAMDWYADMRVVNGVLTTNHKGMEGGHCMFIYGWEKRGWRVQNSWGENWGTDGTFVLPYELGMTECWAVMDDIVGDLEVKMPFASRLGHFIAKIINVVCNHSCKKK